MYDRILELLTERSKATRAKVAAMGGNAAFKQAAGAQKDDILAKRAETAAKAAKVARIQQQGKSQPPVGVSVAGRTGMGVTGGGGGGRLPRAPVSTVLGSIKRGTSAAQKEVPTTAASAPMSTTARRRLQGAAFKIANRQRQAAALERSKAAAKPDEPMQGPEFPTGASSPANVPFNRTYRRVLGAMKKAKPALSMKMKGLDMGPVTNAFNVRSEPTSAKIQQGGQNPRNPRNPDPRSETVTNLLKGLTGRKSMHNRPSYRP